MKHESAPAPQVAAADAGESFGRAMSIYEAGDLAAARSELQALLEGHPKHLPALEMLATIAFQTGNTDEAIRLLDTAIEIDPSSPTFYSNRGILLQQLHRLDAAVESYDKAIERVPDFVGAYCNRAAALNLLGRFDEAIESCDRAIALKPDQAEAHLNRGIALAQLQQLEKALASFDMALLVRADYAEAYCHRGSVLHRLNELNAAVASFDTAIALKPDYADAYIRRGLALEALQQSDAAIASFDKAIAIQPGNADAHFGRGISLQRLKRPEAALQSFDAAIAIQPRFAEAHTNRGRALHELRQSVAAVASFDQAIALSPNLVEALANRGGVLMELGQMDGAMASLDRAVAVAPDYALGHWNRALALLLLGDFDRGWPEYEWRWRNEALGLPRRQFDRPLWLGREPLSGKTILLHAEQGLGDTIQFCRYAKRVADLGARVVLQAPGPLVRLLKTLPGVTAVFAEGSVLPDFDFHCPLLSLPLAFKTQIRSIPSAAGYLHADPASVARWRQTLGQRTRPRIGLIWSGRAEHQNDHNRSIALATLLSHLPGGFDYVSLQKEVREADRAALSSRADLRHFGVALSDLTDTAALCSLMDIVLSVDTSVAHLSGALGRPTWILLPFSPDWRWLLDREDSPWYPTVKLYRQRRIGDWNEVLDRVAADLQDPANLGLSQVIPVRRWWSPRSLLKW